MLKRLTKLTAVGNNIGRIESKENPLKDLTEYIVKSNMAASTIKFT